MGPGHQPHLKMLDSLCLPQIMKGPGVKTPFLVFPSASLPRMVSPQLPHDAHLVPWPQNDALFTHEVPDVAPSLREVTDDTPPLLVTPCSPLVLLSFLPASRCP